MVPQGNPVFGQALMTHGRARASAHTSLVVIVSLRFICAEEEEEREEVEEEEEEEVSSRENGRRFQLPGPREPIPTFGHTNLKRFHESQRDW